MENLTLAFILIGGALVLAVGELLLPTGGVLLIVAGILDLIGVVMVFVYGDRYLGIATVAGEAVILPLLAALFFWVWPRTPLGRRLMILNDEQATIAQLPEIQGLEALRGRIGKAVSVMRPAGVVEFDGRRVDCLSEGVLIEPETWVKCVDVKSGRVVVRPVDRPPELADLGDIRYE